MRAPFIGRRMELEAVVTRLKATIVGSGGLIAVRGEPGVGKSRFLDEVAEQAALLGFRVLRGRGDELQRNVPYGVFRGALAEAVAAEQRGPHAELAAEVSRALGLEIDPIPSADGSLPSAGYAAGNILLRTWAQRKPVLLTLDDLHDADHDTLVVLGVLHQTIAQYACAIVISYRWPLPQGNRDLELLINRLESEEGLAVELGPLDADDARALSSSLLDAVPDQRLDAVLWESTRGNPFFLEEMVRSLNDEGALSTAEGTAHLVGEATMRFANRRESVLNRVVRAGESGTEVARALSVFTRMTLDQMPMLIAVTGLDPAAVEVAFDALVKAGIVREVDGVYAFSHPLLRETLYWDIGPAERRRLHQVIAGELARRRAVSGRGLLELAYHVAEFAEPGDEVSAAILIEAADASSTAPRAAASWYGRALDVLPVDAPQRGRVLAQRSRALYLAWDLEPAVSVGRDALQSLPPGQQRDRVAGIVVGSLTYLGRFDEALALSRAMLDAGAAGSSRVQTQQAALLLFTDRLDEAEREALVAVDTAAGDRGAELLARGVLCALAAVRGDVAAVRRLAREQVEAARGVSDGALVVALSNAGSQLSLSGEVPLAEAFIAEARLLIDRLGTPAFGTNLDLAEVWLAWLAGRWDAALGRARGAALQPDAHAVTGDAMRGVAAAILAERGEYAEARAVAGDEPVIASSRSVLVWALSAPDVASGRLDRARLAIEAALTEDAAAGRRLVKHLLLGRLVDIALAEGRRDEAERRAGELESVALATDSNWVRAEADRAAGVVWSDPVKLSAALHCAEENALLFHAAVCHHELGRAGAGSEHFVLALNAFRQLGAELWRQRTASEMRHRGLKIPRTKRTASGLVSEAEARVARLVGEGLTSRQIANALFLSEKTVEIYLSRIYAKTGYRNRLELALASRLGQLERS